MEESKTQVDTTASEVLRKVGGEGIPGAFTKAGTSLYVKRQIVDDLRVVEHARVEHVHSR